MQWDRLAIVDVETTGGSPQYDRVIEVGIIAIDYGQVTGTYSQLVNPNTWLPPTITNLTGIKPEDLEDKPLFGEVASNIFCFLDNRVMVAHNARFDLGFLKGEFARLGYAYSPKHLCSVRLSRRLFPKYRRHSLDNLIERFDLKVEARHRALGDAQAIWDFFQKLPHLIDEKPINEAISILAKTPALPPQLKKSVIDGLPSAPGVYIFYDTNRVPLYIGKSVNVKERVLSHFYADLESERELAIKNQVVKIDVISAAGDLEAQLTESRLVKELMPIYNRKLRVTRELVALTLKMNTQNYLTAELNPIEQMPANWGSMYGIYKSRKQAETIIKEIVEKHNLCWKLMGLETTKKACFGYHLGQCQGACVGREPTAKYNLRVLTAFRQKKMLDWPFAGAIAIKEADDINKRAVTHVFNNWQHLGTYEVDNVPDTDLSVVPGTLNLDTYKILKRFLQANSHRVKLVDSDKIGL